MALKELIQNNMKTALLGGDRFVGDVLRNLKAAILNEEVATGKRDEGISDEEIEKIIAREVKKRKESIKLYEQNDRMDLAEIEKQELAVLETYLPKQVSEEEIQSAVDGIIDGIGEVSMQHMGKIIGQVKAKYGNSADGATVSRIVKDSLQT